MVVLGGRYGGRNVWALSLGETPTWTPLAPGGPILDERCGYTALYDPVRDRALIFGGARVCSSDYPINDTWALTWGTPLLPPPAVTAEAGPGSVAVSWAPSPSANVVAYRVSYGTPGEAVRYSGTQAAEGASGIEVPASQTSLSLTCLPDSLFRIVVQAVAPSGGRSPWSEEVVARPGRIGGTLAVSPEVLNRRSTGGLVTAVLEPAAEFSAEQVMVETLRLNESLAPERVLLGDANGNRVADLLLMFARDQLMALLPAGEVAEVRVAGRLRPCGGALTCEARDTVRLLGPKPSLALAGAAPEPARTELLGAQPNPFRPGGQIAFVLARAERVTLRMFDVRGRLVGTLLERALPAGRHEVAWDARGVAAGVYFVQLRSEGLRQHRRLVVVRD
jgi:hypothetical protein